MQESRDQALPEATKLVADVLRHASDPLQLRRDRPGVSRRQESTDQAGADLLRALPRQLFAQVRKAQE